MADLRGYFPDYSCNIGIILEAHQTMQHFMWQPNLLQVARILDAGMKTLQTVDPNGGSNI